MRSLVDSLNRPWQVLNTNTGNIVLVPACNAEAAVLLASQSERGSQYWDMATLEVGEKLTMLGDYVTLNAYPNLEDIFNA
jgi:hypothetical protein